MAGRVLNESQAQTPGWHCHYGHENQLFLSPQEREGLVGAGVDTRQAKTTKINTVGAPQNFNNFSPVKTPSMVRKIYVYRVQVFSHIPRSIKLLMK